MITSTSNDHIKQIRKLRERKERQQSGLFYIEGLRIIGEAVQQGEALETLIVAPQLLKGDFSTRLIEEQKRKGTLILEVSQQVFESFALREGPKGLAAVVRQRWEKLVDISLRAGDIWVALDSVQDPGNLGTILRTLDSAGGCGVILLDNATDPYDPTAVRASMGSIFSQRLVKTSFDEFAHWKQRSGVPVIGTSGTASVDYHYNPFPEALVLLMGSERQGLQEHHLQLCDQIVRIPMVGRSDSLNLAVSTALVIYEIVNQRRDALIAPV
jgi:TrmH family RNA methyltransferase